MIRTELQKAVAGNVRRSRKRRRTKRKIAKWGRRYIQRENAELPTPTYHPPVDDVARGLLGDDFPLRIAAFIELLKAIDMADGVAKRFCHSVLSWTFHERRWRFPEKSGEVALQKIDQCSTGRLSDKEAQKWIQGFSFLPNQLNGKNTTPHRINSNGHNRDSYKNAVFQAAIGNVAQYAYRKDDALEMSVLAAVVNVRTKDPIERHLTVLNQLRLT